MATRSTTRRTWCPCRVGVAFSVLALIGAFMANTTVAALVVTGWAALVIGAPLGMGLCLRGCGSTADDDLTERTVAHTGVALSVLSLVVFVI